MNISADGHYHVWLKIALVNMSGAQIYSSESISAKNLIFLSICLFSEIEDINFNVNILLAVQ
jgi:hypothetical protein